MLDIDSYHIEVLRTTANGLYSITGLVRALNMSPNTIVKKVNELLEHGFLERMDVSKYGGGNSPKVVSPSEEGKKLLGILAAADFRFLHKKHNVLAGPKLTFSRLGITFIGGRDLFAPKHVETPFYDVVVCDPFMFEDIVEGDGLVYPGIESFIVWIIESRNPRFIGATPLILKALKDVDLDHLKYLAMMREAIRRLNLLLEIAGLEKYADMSLQGPDKTETMLEVVTTGDERMSELGRKYGVVNVPSKQLFEDMEKLYGGSLKW
ncbi:MAG: hypothetical protein ACE5QW_06800 [Thermoplasmata archaeon]